jgi:hypothetical protein
MVGATPVVSLRIWGLCHSFDRAVLSFSGSLPIHAHLSALPIALLPGEGVMQCRRTCRGGALGWSQTCCPGGR